MAMKEKGKAEPRPDMDWKLPDWTDLPDLDWRLPDLDWKLPDLDWKLPEWNTDAIQWDRIGKTGKRKTGRRPISVKTELRK